MGAISPQPEVIHWEQHGGNFSQGLQKWGALNPNQRKRLSGYVAAQQKPGSWVALQSI